MCDGIIGWRAMKRHIRVYTQTVVGGIGVRLVMNRTRNYLMRVLQTNINSPVKFLTRTYLLTNFLSLTVIGDFSSGYIEKI